LRTVASASAADAASVLVVEAHQRIAGDHLIVEGNEHLGDAARYLRAHPHLADRLNARSGRGCPAALACHLRLGRAFRPDGVDRGLGALHRRLGANVCGT
jgi:hypothetical protein